MMNPYYYLFYKLSRFLNRKGNNEWGPVYALTVLAGWNIGFAFIKVLPVTQENFKTYYQTKLALILIVLFITNSILFLDKNRVKKIINRYNIESDISRRIGSFFVILYVVLSLGLFIFL